MARKPRNIIIYSDGTGQRGGVSFDERRSNIYKLYRATRCGPDSAIDPSEQAAFYDAGIGTAPPGAGFFIALWQKIYNAISQALGLGLTGNIIDCYAALVRMWQPGDRIFLIGFSRGAYTVRCLGGVLALCGVPTMEDGAGLKRDMATSKRIAEVAVKKVYQHTHSWNRNTLTPRQQALLDQRQELALQFRAKYGAGDAVAPNEVPYFVGVFDTVASLANLGVLIALIAISLVLLAGVAGLINWLWPYGPFEHWWAWYAALAVAVVGGALLWNLKTRIRSERGLKNASWLGFHVNEWRMRFYDRGLNPRVAYARHAISIDEARESFPRVPWGTKGAARPSEPGQPEWFQQIWFAGCHSDIGGSYPEDESRLSDIALGWMLDAAVSVGLKVDPSVLKLYPDAMGMQHDETRSWVFRFARKAVRTIPENAPLHPSVLDRFRAATVQQYDVSAPYRPENLRGHKDAGLLF
jgi:uncharacterized protein (DUF2235 family)